MSSVDQLFQDAFALSPEIKLKLIHELWDDLAANPSDVPVHDWQIEELERRKQKLSEDPTTAMSWDEFDRRLRERSTRCCTPRVIQARGNHASSSRLAFRMAENGINSVLRYRRGFNTTVANGGSVRLIEQGRPWLGISSPCTPG